MTWADTFPLTFVIMGEPCSWKNSKRIVRRGKFPKLLPSTKSAAWMDDAVDQLKEQWTGTKIPKALEINAEIVSYLPTHRLIDSDNLYGGPGDALERAGILENDSCIVSHDGSRRRYDKHNPRVEITLTLVAEPKQTELDLGGGGGTRKKGKFPKTTSAGDTPANAATTAPEMEF